MDFDLTEEQRLLKDSVERLLLDHYDFESRKVIGASAQGWSGAIWAQFAELGLFGVSFSEEDGGFGGGAVETMIVMEAFGQSLVLEPYFASIVLGGGLLRLAANAKQRAEIIPRLAGGELTLAFAHSERQAGFDLSDVGVTARAEGAEHVLNGEKGLVLAGDSAGLLIVSARSSGERRDETGISLFLVEADAPGVSRRGYPTQDGGRAAEISFKDVRVGQGQMLGAPGAAFPIIEQVIHEAIAAVSAEAVGAMAEANRLTIDYLKTRKQFGVPIGSFQVLQHRASDMFVALEQARSMALYATMMVGESDAAERRKAMSAAKIQIGRSGRFIGEQAVQMHGGIGMTMEYKLGHLFKRLKMIDILFGDADHHLEKLADTDGLLEAL